MDATTKAHERARRMVHELGEEVKGLDDKISRILSEKSSYHFLMKYSDTKNRIKLLPPTNSGRIFGATRYSIEDIGIALRLPVPSDVESALRNRTMTEEQYLACQEAAKIMYERVRVA